jgi:hypothetical protein
VKCILIRKQKIVWIWIPKLREHDEEAVENALSGEINPLFVGN